MAFTIDTTGLTQYCPPTTPPAETIIPQISIFKQCLPINPVAPATGPLVLSIAAEDIRGEGQGLSMTANKRMRPINTAASETEVANLYSGQEILWTVELQKGAFGKTIDEIIEGVAYVASTVRTGWDELKLADRSGQLVSTFSVLFSYYSSGNLLAQDWAPTAEVSMTGGGGMAANQTYYKTIQIKAQSIGDAVGTRVIRYRQTTP